MIEQRKRKSRLLTLTLIAVLLLTLFNSGCKKDPLPDPVSFTIKADKNILIADGTDILTFTATDSDNNDITSKCQFLVGDKQLDGNSYTTTQEGVQIFSGQYKSVKSNSLIIEARVKYRFIIDKTTILADGIDKAVISVIDYLNVSKSDQTTFYINDQAITGNAFSTTVAGAYTMIATIDGYTFTKEVSAGSTVTFKSRVLIEDYTGAWCGYCPRMTTAIEKATTDNSNILVMAIHNGDGMATAYESALRSRFNVTGFPSARINRTMVWDEKASSLLQFFKSDIPFGVAVRSTISGTHIEAEINLRFNSPPGENIKIAAFIIEDNIIASQANYYSDGRGNPITGFIHSAVLREKLSISLLGDPVNTEGVTAGSSITLNLSQSINPSWRTENCKILVIVAKESNDQVITCQQAHVGYGVGY